MFCFGSFCCPSTGEERFLLKGLKFESHLDEDATTVAASIPSDVQANHDSGEGNVKVPRTASYHENELVMNEGDSSGNDSFTLEQWPGYLLPYRDVEASSSTVSSWHKNVSIAEEQLTNSAYVEKLTDDELFFPEVNVSLLEVLTAEFPLNSAISQNTLLASLNNSIGKLTVFPTVGVTKNWISSNQSTSVVPVLQDSYPLVDNNGISEQKHCSAGLTGSDRTINVGEEQEVIGTNSGELLSPNANSESGWIFNELLPNFHYSWTQFRTLLETWLQRNAAHEGNAEKVAETGKLSFLDVLRLALANSDSRSNSNKMGQNQVRASLIHLPNISTSPTIHQRNSMSANFSGHPIAMPTVSKHIKSTTSLSPIVTTWLSWTAAKTPIHIALPRKLTDLQKMSPNSSSNAGLKSLNRKNQAEINSNSKSVLSTASTLFILRSDEKRSTFPSVTNKSNSVLNDSVEKEGADEDTEMDTEMAAENHPLILSISTNSEVWQVNLFSLKGQLLFVFCAFLKSTLWSSHVSLSV